MSVLVSFAVCLVIVAALYGEGRPLFFLGIVCLLGIGGLIGLTSLVGVLRGHHLRQA